jgi:2-amino-4-hydroxy-6-hydroxymethyldihydropteridine diphosphokinase
MKVIAYLALGSNLGDRRAYLDAAIAALEQGSTVKVRQVSSYWETLPVGGPPGQGAYLNAAACIETTLSARDLLELLLATERQLGRVRNERFGPRTIDLDLLLYGEEVIDEPGLTVPHPRLHERIFVLGPLAEIAPTLVHPQRQRSMVELLAQASTRDLHGRRALVTGSSSGIGRAIALALAAAGADVVIHARKSAEQARSVCALARQQGVRSEVLMADLRSADACRRLIEEAWDRFGAVDIWINNAGADTLTGAAARGSFEEKLRELLAVDVTATMLLGREVGRRMKAAGQGVIVNMGWDQAETGMEGDSGQLFAASKAAVMAFTKSLALSLAPEVRVNCLAPGWIRTAWSATASETWQRRAVQEAPLRRWGTPEDVAAVTRWLVSPAASFVTGQVIRINGGAVR